MLMDGTFREIIPYAVVAEIVTLLAQRSMLGEREVHLDAVTQPGNTQ